MTFSPLIFENFFNLGPPIFRKNLFIGVEFERGHSLLYLVYKQLCNKEIFFTCCSDLMFLENKLSDETIYSIIVIIASDTRGRIRESGAWLTPLIYRVRVYRVM